MIFRSVEAGDRTAWGDLYRAYAEFYGVPQTDQMRDRVWGWLTDSSHDVLGFVAEKDGTLIGLAHCRPFARPLAAASGLFLDDLFVTPDVRGGRVGAALIDAVKTQAMMQGHSVVRWITAQDNATARGLYDQVATATQWVTYDIDV